VSIDTPTSAARDWRSEACPGRAGPWPASGQEEADDAQAAPRHHSCSTGDPLHLARRSTRPCRGTGRAGPGGPGQRKHRRHNQHPAVLTATDPDGGSLDVRFEGRKAGATVPGAGTGDPFTIVALPDLQNYTYNNRQGTIVQQAQWAVVGQYFPVRYSASEGMAALFSDLPQYEQAWNLLQGETKVEPQLASYDVIREEAAATFQNLLASGGDVETAMNELNTTANEIMASFQP
jgi:hypothetical protein